MTQLPCPFCGLRDVAEFGYCGEVLARPDPAATTPAEWRTYLYVRRNPLGWVEERWYHHAGCRRYFRLERETLGNETRPGHRR